MTTYYDLTLTGIDELQLSMTEIILQKWVNHLTPENKTATSLKLPVIPPIPLEDDDIEFVEH